MTQLLQSKAPESQRPAALALAAAGMDGAGDVPDSGVSAAQAEADAALTARKRAEEAAEREAAALHERRVLLMQKIDAQPDFASMKESMAGIQKIARSDRAHARAMTNLIHDDAAMVSKLLRLINAAYYSSVGGGAITSLQRAVSLMGF